MNTEQTSENIFTYKSRWCTRKTGILVFPGKISFLWMPFSVKETSAVISTYCVPEIAPVWRLEIKQLI